ncbi:putative cell cycle control protein [Phaeoacremonium minimum UCRPA7]|uniref:Putative cell cycle control protein n=1 Tax=Phaeoacremonium minimum (strain UCR-PA7) TaxID=1286976 RepID=R8BU38_PHAM7|nr:putative cell cycle control protein [Phaeoacremonium minimum UCRPA7]EOO02871.1 putative cell cycle control protein [Phaeoacremonium minimum UCRPA7]
MAGLGRLNAQVDVDVQIIGQNNVAPPPNPLANNPVDFNYQANGFGGFGGRAPTPKPVFEPLPPPREGFTRESGPDVVVICPSCDEELKYNSEDKEDGPPTKKPRTRKDREEHHFWAVKACGHVFCKKCYDNRKSSSLSSFRRETVSNSKQPKYLCAVDDCDSEVSQKTAWVGIFM